MKKLQAFFLTTAVTVWAVHAMALAGPGAKSSNSLSAGHRTSLSGSPPVVTTGGATNITSTSATLTGTINPYYDRSYAYFDYGTTTSYGSSTPTDTFDVPGGALYFNGSSSSGVSTPVTTEIDDITMEAWVDWYGGTAANQVILLNGSSSSTGYAIVLIYGEGNNIELLCGGVAVVSTGVTMTVGNWYHLVAVRRSGNWEFYINGVAQSLGGNPVPNPLGVTDSTWVGSNHVRTENFNGVIDEIRIWNAAVSLDDIRAWSHRNITASHPNRASLAAYWQCNYSGSTTPDSSGNGNTLGGNLSFTTPTGRTMYYFASVSGLDPDSTYDYRLHASNTIGPGNGTNQMFTTLAPLPIQLSSFTATSSGANTVRLDWTTVSETNCYGYFVERRLESEPSFSTVSGLIAGAGTSLALHNYSWTDNPGASGDYVYRLKQVDLSGGVTYSDPVKVRVVLEVSDNSAPKIFQVMQNYPNPFNPTTSIEFSVDRTEHATVAVYNTLGEEVARLFDGTADPGNRYRLNLDGSHLASGEYMYRVVTESHHEVRKMILMK